MIVTFQKELISGAKMEEIWEYDYGDNLEEKLADLGDMARRWDENELTRIVYDGSFAPEAMSRATCLIKGSAKSKDFRGFSEMDISISAHDGDMEWFANWRTAANLVAWIYENGEAIWEVLRENNKKIREIQQDFKGKILAMDPSPFDELLQRRKQEEGKRKRDELLFRGFPGDRQDVPTMHDPDGGTWYYDENNSAWLDMSPEMY